MEVDEAKEAYGDAKTRCPCGDNDDTEGFMIQCENATCQVWQHGECIGISERDVPEEYYCELCDPTNPIHVRRAELMKLRAASLNQKPPKRPGKQPAPRNVAKQTPGPKPPKKPSTKKTPNPKRPRDLASPMASPSLPTPVASPAASSTATPMADDAEDLARKRPRLPSTAAPAVGPSGSDGEALEADGTPARMSREDRKLKQIMDSFMKLERKDQTKQQRRVSSSTPGGKISENGMPQDDDRSISRVPNKKSSSQERTQSPTSAHSGASSPSSSGGNMSRRVRHLKNLSPMYLGKKQWLLSAYRDDLSKQQHATATPPLSDSLFPVGKRILAAHQQISGIENKHPFSNGGRGGFNQFFFPHPRHMAVDPYYLDEKDRVRFFDGPPHTPGVIPASPFMSHSTSPVMYEDSLGPSGRRMSMRYRGKEDVTNSPPDDDSRFFGGNNSNSNGVASGAGGGGGASTSTTPNGVDHARVHLTYPAIPNGPVHQSSMSSTGMDVDSEDSSQAETPAATATATTTAASSRASSGSGTSTSSSQARPDSFHSSPPPLESSSSSNLRMATANGLHEANKHSSSAAASLKNSLPAEVISC